MKTYKVIYNKCFGGFNLSEEAQALGEEISGIQNWGRYSWYLQRHDPVLVEVFEQLGSDRASGFCSELAVIEITGRYRVDEYDGAETVYEPDDYDYVDPSVIKAYGEKAYSEEG